MAVFAHKPVLLEETVRALRPCAGKVFVDGTLGRAG
ncbi:MAG TPA: 16S rRNA (cytosine(1402)-N(4))-methyltransferase, partial [Verrucomicrobia bacterium]|nr:16S rRNA (cytosine(1402)-N(4))-methyltransferase [Verrucomicrobiota bacterium]